MLARLIGEDHAAEDWPRNELEVSLGLIVDGGAGDIGWQQVRRELYPTEVGAYRVGDGPCQERLPHAWEVVQQEVSTRQQGGDAQPDDRFLGHHNAGDVLDQGISSLWKGVVQRLPSLDFILRYPIPTQGVHLKPLWRVGHASVGSRGRIG